MTRIISREDGIALIQRTLAVAKAAGKQPSDAISEVPPLAIKFTVTDDIEDLASTRAMLDATVEVTMEINPLFAALMYEIGGESTPNHDAFTFDVSEHGNPKVISGLLKVIPKGIAYLSKHITEHQSQGMLAQRGEFVKLRAELAKYLRKAPTINALQDNAIPFDRHPSTGAAAGSAVALSIRSGKLYVRPVTNRLSEERGLRLDDNPQAVDLDLRRMTGSRSVTVHVDQALHIAALAKDHEWPVIDNGAIGRISSGFETTAMLRRVPGSPASAYLTMPTNDRIEHRQLSCWELASFRDERQEANDGLVVISDETVLDIAAMTSPVPFTEADEVELASQGILSDTARLAPFQRQVVAMHAATNIGMVNSSTTGTGKTVMAVVGCAVRAEQKRHERRCVQA